MSVQHEEHEQILVMHWARVQQGTMPELKLLYHVPNEGKRTASAGGRLKAAGMRAGVPDLCLPVPRGGYHGLYIEMKYGKNKPTQAQNEWLNALREQGYFTAVCYGFYETVNTIRQYLQGGKA